MIEKDIPGYVGLYKVREDGQIRSLDRYNIDKNGKKKFYPGRVLKQSLIVNNHTNYKYVTLSNKGKLKRLGVHQVVALAFTPNPENKPIVNHIDNNGENNHYTNLEWVTHKENMLHAQKQGRLFVSQSKAGKVAGKIAKDRGYLYSDKFIQTQVNDWFIIGYDLNNSHKNKYVKAKCTLCNTIHSVCLSTITTHKSKHCMSCGNRIRFKKERDALIRKYTKAVVNNIFIDGLAYNRKCDNKPIMETKCLDCGKLHYLDINTLKTFSCDHRKCGRKPYKGKDIVSSA